jgi:predicted secreted hydrolase
MSQTTSTTTIDGVAYHLTDLRSVINIARDMPRHARGWANESWFIVANLEAGLERLGFQLHVLLMDLPTGAAVSLNVNIVNETAGWSHALEYVHRLDDIEISTERFSIVTPALRFEGSPSRLDLHLEGERVALDISAKAAAPPVLMNGQGQTLFIDVDQYEYAFPAMVTTGSVMTDEGHYQVSGISWFDRQWGNLPDFFAHAPANGESAPSMNWMWSNVQLDNGTNIALGQVRDGIHHNLFLGLTAADRHGTHLVVNTAEPLETSEYWTSPRTGRRYPTRCVFRAPQIDTELIIEVGYKDQEIVSKVGGMTKYEGASAVSGRYQGKPVSGRGYLELVGLWG